MLDAKSSSHALRALSSAGVKFDIFINPFLVQRKRGRTGRLTLQEVEPPTAETVVVESFRENTFRLENEHASNLGPAIPKSSLAEKGGWAFIRGDVTADL